MEQDIKNRKGRKQLQSSKNRDVCDILLSIESLLDKHKKRDFWDKLKIASGFFAEAVIPIVLFILSINVDTFLKEREIQTKKLDLAIGILKDEVTLDRLEIRSWAANQLFPDDERSRKAILSSSLIGRLEELRWSKEELDKEAKIKLKNAEADPIFIKLSDAFSHLALDVLLLLTEGEHPLLPREKLNEFALENYEDPYYGLIKYLKEVLEKNSKVGKKMIAEHNMSMYLTYVQICSTHADYLQRYVPITKL